jgi:hypothetical protein
MGKRNSHSGSRRSMIDFFNISLKIFRQESNGISLLSERNLIDSQKVIFFRVIHTF